MGILDFFRSSVGCDIENLGVSPGEGINVKVGGHPRDDSAREGFDPFPTMR